MEYQEEINALRKSAPGNGTHPDRMESIGEVRFCGSRSDRPHVHGHDVNIEQTLL